jgi:hypothetical protein
MEIGAAASDAFIEIVAYTGASRFNIVSWKTHFASVGTQHSPSRGFDPILP